MSDSENTNAAQGKYSGLRPWQKGQSGNPGGRPKANAALRQKCRDLTDAVVARLKDLAMTADSDTASIAAIKLLLAYGHGAPEARPIDEDEADKGGARWSPDEAKALLGELRAQRRHEPDSDAEH